MDMLFDSQKRYIKENFRAKSDSQIAKSLGVKKRAVRKALKSMGLERTREDRMNIRKNVSTKGYKKPDGRPETKKWVHAACIAFILIAVFTAYANSLQNGFIWDDEFLVRDNLYIKGFGHLKEIFSSFLASSSNNINNFYRPIQDLSYMIDHFLWGDDPMGFHLTNVMLHAACAVLVYLLFIRIAGNYRIAFITGLLFGIHPVNTEAVTYIAGRADPLYLAFFLLSFLFFFKTMDGFGKDYKTDPRLYGLSLIFYMLSILSKEIGLILPALLFLYQKTYVSDPRVQRKARGLLIPYCCILLIYITLRKTILDFSGISPSFIMAEYPFYQRMLTTFKAVAIYLRLLILPLGLHMERSVRVARSLFEPAALGSFIGMITVFFVVFEARKRRLNGLFFFPLWFFMCLVPVSNIVPINSFIAEHWVYLPAIGVFAVAGIGIEKVFGTKYGKAASILLIAAISVFYIHLTAERNKDWKDEITFFKKTLVYSPDNPKLHLNFGNTYAEMGRKDDAVKEYEKAIELRPDDAVAYSNLGSIYIGLGRLEQAGEYIEMALEIKPDFPNALYNIGYINRRRGNSEEAVENFKTALKYNPHFLDCHIELGSIYLKRGSIDEARYHWREALRLDPKHKEAKRFLDEYPGQD